MNRVLDWSEIFIANQIQRPPDAAEPTIEYIELETLFTRTHTRCQRERYGTAHERICMFRSSTGTRQQLTFAIIRTIFILFFLCPSFRAFCHEIGRWFTNNKINLQSVDRRCDTSSDLLIDHSWDDSASNKVNLWTLSEYAISTMLITISADVASFASVYIYIVPNFAYEKKTFANGNAFASFLLATLICMWYIFCFLFDLV